MKNVIFLVLSILLCSCNFKVIKTDMGRKQIVIKSSESNEDSLRYDYLFGNTFCKTTSFNLDANKRLKRSLTYHKNGKVMSYRIHHENNLVYYRIYDEKGKSIKYGGRGILGHDSISYIDLKIGSKYNMSFKLVDPPYCRIVVLMGEERPGKLEDRDMDKYPIRMYDVKNSEVSFIVDADSIGIQKYEIDWAIEDTVSGDIQKGKIIHQYNFVPQ